MADLSYPAGLVPLPSAVQGRGKQVFTTVALTPLPGHPQSDLRNHRANTGTISDVMVLKTAGGEVPYVNGLVWLLRLADGYKAWQGYTDAAGAYTATDLELGIEYVAVGIDPKRQHKTTGAGPVMSA
jgi:hypothetical protein